MSHPFGNPRCISCDAWWEVIEGMASRNTPPRKDGDMLPTGRHHWKAYIFSMLSTFMSYYTPHRRKKTLTAYLPSPFPGSPKIAWPTWPRLISQGGRLEVQEHGLWAHSVIAACITRGMCSPSWVPAFHVIWKQMVLEPATPAPSRDVGWRFRCKLEKQDVDFLITKLPSTDYRRY